MKTYQLESWFSLHRFSPGRRAFCARRMREAQTSVMLGDVIALCDAIIAAEREQIAVQKAWREGQAAGPGGGWTPEILALDLVLDRLIVQLRDLLAALAVVPDDRGKAAQKLLTKHFAEGPTFYTHAIIEEEAERVGQLVDALSRTPEDVATATVQRLVADITAKHAEYAALVNAAKKPARTSFEEVKAVDLKNQRRFLRLVMLALNATDTDAGPTPDRQLLLSIVAEQDADIAAAIRAKRAVKDVDPDTGETEPGDGNA